jgi:hypothetical protein
MRSLKVVAVRRQGAAVGQAQVALCAIERLDRGLLVDTEHNRVFRRRKVEADDIGSFGRELWILALAPALAAAQIAPSRS